MTDQVPGGSSGAPAGYSKRALVDKLGVKPGHRVLLVNPPEGYLAAVAGLTERATVVAVPEPELDMVQVFVRDGEELRGALPALIDLLVPNGMIWVSWAKKSSPLHTGLTETEVRELGLAAGVVDVKVAAITEDWSGLKFVIRLQDRPARPSGRAR
jgi:predicted CoA-binding protein